MCVNDPGHLVHSCVLTVPQLSGIIKFSLLSPLLIPGDVPSLPLSALVMRFFPSYPALP